MAQFQTTADGYGAITFKCPLSSEPITLTFGYLRGEPVMPILKGEPQAEGVADLVTMIPRALLIQALKEGWDSAESGWWVDPGNN